MPRQTPPEIIDHIVELCDHRPTLLTAALASKSLLSVARATFFNREISLLHNRKNHLDATLPALLKNSHSTLPRYLRHIKATTPNSTSQADDARLQPILEAFEESGTQVLTLVIGNCDRHAVAQCIPAFIHHARQSLVRLLWHNFKSPFTNDVVRWIAECTHLQYISIVSSTADRVVPLDMESSLRAPASLRKVWLEFDAPHLHSFIKWLVKSECYPTHYILGASVPEELSTFEQAMSIAMLENIQSLKLTLSPMYHSASSQVYDFAISLALFSGLRSIVLDLASMDGSHPFTRDFPCAPSFALLPPGRRFDHIEVTFTWMRSGIQWLSSLDELFSTRIAPGGVAHVVQVWDEDPITEDDFPKSSRQDSFRLLLEPVYPDIRVMSSYVSED